MKKLTKLWALWFTSLMLLSNIIFPVAYANEVDHELRVQQETELIVTEVEDKLSKPIAMSEDDLNAVISENKSLYPSLSEERMKEIAYQVLTPYQTRGSVWDGQGVTLDEFAWAFNIILSGILEGIASLPKLAAQKGIKAAKAVMSRALVAAAKRVGVYAGIIPGLIRTMVGLLNIYYNVGYAAAQFIDARDYHPNNGRINVWA